MTACESMGTSQTQRRSFARFRRVTPGRSIDPLVTLLRKARQLAAKGYFRAAVFTIFALAVAWPVLATAGEMNIFRDAQVLYAYERDAAWSVLHFGSLPLWDPYYCGGLYALGTPRSRRLGRDVGRAVLCGERRLHRLAIPRLDEFLRVRAGALDVAVPPPRAPGTDRRRALGGAVGGVDRGIRRNLRRADGGLALHLRAGRVPHELGPLLARPPARARHLLLRRDVRGRAGCRPARAARRDTPLGAPDHCGKARDDAVGRAPGLGPAGHCEEWKSRFQTDVRGRRRRLPGGRRRALSATNVADRPARPRCVLPGARLRLGTVGTVRLPQAPSALFRPALSRALPDRRGARGGRGRGKRSASVRDRSSPPDLWPPGRLAERRA